MNKYIQQLITQGENQHLDFKFEISDARKIARTFSSFANTGGGKLLIGVKDNGAIAGVRTDEEIYMLESAADLYCRPKVPYSVKPWNIEGKTILEVTIEESKKKPHVAPWKDDQWRAFVRVKDQNFIANTVQVEVWRNKRSGKPVIVKYNEVERKLLHHLQINHEISLSGFTRLCKIKYPVAKRILVNLVAIGIIEIKFSEKTTTFCLSAQEHLES